MAALSCAVAFDAGTAGFLKRKVSQFVVPTRSAILLTGTRRGCEMNDLHRMRERRVFHF